MGPRVWSALEDQAGRRRGGAPRPLLLPPFLHLPAVNLQNFHELLLLALAPRSASPLPGAWRSFSAARSRVDSVLLVGLRLGRCWLTRGRDEHRNCDGHHGHDLGERVGHARVLGTAAGLFGRCGVRWVAATVHGPRCCCQRGQLCLVEPELVTEFCSAAPGRATALGCWGRRWVWAGRCDATGSRAATVTSVGFQAFNEVQFGAWTRGDPNFSSVFSSDTWKYKSIRRFLVLRLSDKSIAHLCAGKVAYICQTALYDCM